MSYQVFNTSGSWVCPSGVTRAVVKCWGAGGGGGGGIANLWGGGGGGGGAYAQGVVIVVPGSTYTVTVGDKGVGSAGNDGTAGTVTQFTLAASVKTKAVPGGFGTKSEDPDVNGLGGAGGLDSDCIGDITESGLDGNTALSGTGGDGGDAARDGNGSAGATSGNSAGDADAPGGGGGGGGDKNVGNTSGGDGSVGKIYLEWYKDNEVVNIISNA